MKPGESKADQQVIMDERLATVREWNRQQGERASAIAEFSKQATDDREAARQAAADHAQSARAIQRAHDAAAEEETAEEARHTFLGAIKRFFSWEDEEEK
jgi:hypothetical protein